MMFLVLTKYIQGCSISKTQLRNLDGVLLATGAIFKDGRHNFDAFQSFCDISANKAARALKLVSLPMFMITRDPMDAI